MNQGRRTPRRGLTLLEVMLALAILGGALAVIGEITRIGARNAEMARDSATAQRLCENKMAEIAAGLMAPQTVTNVPVEELSDQQEWTYTIEVEQLQETGLIGVWVTVQQSPELVSRPASFTLARWMIDPEMAATQSQEAAGTTSSSSTGTSSTGGTSP